MLARGQVAAKPSKPLKGGWVCTVAKNWKSPTAVGAKGTDARPWQKV